MQTLYIRINYNKNSNNMCDDQYENFITFLQVIYLQFTTKYQINNEGDV